MPYRLAIVFAFFASAFYVLTFYDQSKTIQTPASSIHPDFFNPSLPSIDQIFANDHSWIATLSAQKVRTMIATGDVIPARSVNFQVLQHKDFNWPYLKTASKLRNADITFINLETPLVKNCPLTQTGMIFCGDQGNVDGLVYAGVDVVSLANNHAGNHGIRAVRETTNLLDKNEILATGIDGPVIKDIRGVKFAFLGYNDITKPQPGVSNVDEERIKQEITKVRQQADIVIVTYHWGAEYRNQPDERQKYLGHFTVDAGADLVIGNHPHWIQPVEIYKDKLITYAHGNFVFDQMWSQKTTEGVLGRYIFYDNKLIDIEFIPIQISNFGQPHFITDPMQKNKIIDNMRLGSINLSS